MIVIEDELTDCNMYWGVNNNDYFFIKMREIKSNDDYSMIVQMDEIECQFLIDQLNKYINRNDGRLD